MNLGSCDFATNKNLLITKLKKSVAFVISKAEYIVYGISFVTSGKYRLPKAVKARDKTENY